MTYVAAEMSSLNWDLTRNVFWV